MESTIDKIIDDIDITDLTLIQILSNQQYLENIINAFSNSIIYHSQNKDYYFSFKAYCINAEKTYSSTQLLSLQKAYEEKRISHDLSYYYIIINSKKKNIYLNQLDKILLIFYISREYYKNIYEAVSKARIYRSNVKIFSYTYKPSYELFGSINPKKYDSNKLLLLNEISNTEIFKNKYKNLTNLQIPYILKKNDK
jgi:hypothetical protein